jgi:hypothetical protein
MITVASVSRPELGLADLNLNDHVNYYVAPGIFGGTVSWRRQTVQSPWIEGQFTVGAVRDQVEDKFVVEVLGADQPSLQVNLQNLIKAFSQSSFNLTVQLDTAYYTYACEASDYTIDWTNTRFMAKQVQVSFSLRRSPVPVNGV